MQIPLLRIVCYLSCHSNILLQTVLTNKLQKRKQIDRYSACPVVWGTAVLMVYYSILQGQSFIKSFGSVFVALQMILLTPRGDTQTQPCYIVVAKEALAEV